ncbi:uncharacterized protein LOC120915964 isoform X2 [Rana temporaria]|uniref:uncharacterized protein LOC120915964 isoform X2 n=1 Tax=Rana temporaria TaxID=8407 RepID=UPI001AAC50D8|nr:uncharacterized protein LOC120915964 isoform X2 [Rana temporaria]
MNKEEGQPATPADSTGYPLKPSAQPGNAPNPPGYSPYPSNYSSSPPGYPPNPQGSPPNPQGYPSFPPGQGVNAPNTVSSYGIVQTTYYGGQPQHGVIVTTQPNVIVLPQPVYMDYLAWSILNLIFCNLILGILAVVFSSKTRDAARRGDSTSAASHSRTTFSFNVAALVLGLAGHICWIVLCVIYFPRNYHYYSNYQYYG